MPKIGAKPEPEGPYNLRCARCGCLVEKLVSRFGFDGKPKSWQYRCAYPYHNCGTVERDGCTPVRKYGQATAHAYWDGAGGQWEHPGTAEECDRPECLERHTHKALKSGDRHPGRLVDCAAEECEPPFDRGPWGDWLPASPGYSDEHVESWTDPDPRPDPLAPCPLTGRAHRWTWADDGNGHSGDVCACGAFEE
ncbi:hypothetical protein SEA_MARKY_82 [Streptomyces phage Marky]|nr:hypothetical protein SEA_MARKY_82 [Streptomyces phage Marky]